MLEEVGDVCIHPLQVYLLVVVFEIFLVEFVGTHHLVNILIFHFILRDGQRALTIEVGEVGEKNHPMVGHHRALTYYIREIIFSDVELPIVRNKDHRRPEPSDLFENYLLKKEVNVLRTL